MLKIFFMNGPIEYKLCVTENEERSLKMNSKVFFFFNFQKFLYCWLTALA